MTEKNENITIPPTEGEQKVPGSGIADMSSLQAVLNILIKDNKRIMDRLSVLENQDRKRSFTALTTKPISATAPSATTLPETPSKMARNLALPFSALRERTAVASESTSIENKNSALHTDVEKEDSLLKTPEKLMESSVTPAVYIGDNAKLPDPEMYDGTDKKLASDFILKCELVFEYAPRRFTSDAIKVSYCAQRLKGEAFEFWKTYYINRDTSVIGDWKRFSELFLLNFGDDNESLEAHLKLTTLRQGTMSITDYTRKFNTLRRQTHVNDLALLDLYKNGVNDKIHIALSDLPAGTNLQQLQEKALTVGKEFEKRNLALKIQREMNNSTDVKKQDSKEKEKDNTSSNKSKPASNANKPVSGEKKNSAVSQSSSGDQTFPMNYFKAQRLGVCRFCGSKDHSHNQCVKKPDTLQKSISFTNPSSNSTNSGNLKSQH